MFVCGKHDESDEKDDDDDYDYYDNNNNEDYYYHEPQTAWLKKAKQPVKVDGGGSGALLREE